MVGGEWDGGTLEPNAPSKVVRLVTRDPGDPTWMSQEVSKRLVSVLYPQYAPFVSRLYPITNHLLTSWHIQVAAKKAVRMGKNIRSTHSDPHPISSNKWYFWEMYENMATWPKLGYCREATLFLKKTSTSMLFMRVSAARKSSSRFVWCMNMWIRYDFPKKDKNSRMLLKILNSTKWSKICEPCFLVRPPKSNSLPPENRPFAHERNGFIF